MNSIDSLSSRNLTAYAYATPLLRGLAWLVRSADRRLRLWERRRRERNHLRSLPDYLLRDIGLDVAEAYEEADKPFWRP